MTTYRQGSKGIRQWAINLCTFLIIINKINPYVSLNFGRHYDVESTVLFLHAQVSKTGILLNNYFASLVLLVIIKTLLTLFLILLKT